MLSVTNRDCETLLTVTLLFNYDLYRYSMRMLLQASKLHGCLGIKCM